MNVYCGSLMFPKLPKIHKIIHALTVLIILNSTPASANLSAQFKGTNLIIQEGKHAFIFPQIISHFAHYCTIHAVQRQGKDYFVVYGASEPSRGWPPRNGLCGCGTESSILWLHVRDGKIIEKQEGRYQSCFLNREGWLIKWVDHKLVWETEGIQSEAEPDGIKFVVKQYGYHWTYDPRFPAKGIIEAKKPLD